MCNSPLSKRWGDYIQRLPPLQNNNISKSVIWGIGWEFFYFVERSCSAFEIFKFLYFYPSYDLANLRHDEDLHMRQGAFFWAANHQVTELGQLIKSDNFQESFAQFGGMGSVLGPFQLSNLIQLLSNQLC